MFSDIEFYPQPAELKVVTIIQLELTFLFDALILLVLFEGYIRSIRNQWTGLLVSHCFLIYSMKRKKKKNSQKVSQNKNILCDSTCSNEIFPNIFPFLLIFLETWTFFFSSVALFLLFSPIQWMTMFGGFSMTLFYQWHLMISWVSQ